MSIKIYNGHKFKENMSLLELSERMLALRDVYRKEVRSYTKKLFMNLVYFYEDLYIIDPELYIAKMKQFGPFVEIHNKEDYVQIIARNVALNLSEHIRESMDSSKYNPVYDVSSNLQIFPLKDKILFGFYGNQNFERILEREPDIEEYYYQDQSDMPEDMSDEEWEQRRIDWEHAIPSGIPARNGFGVELIVPADIPLRLSEWIDENDLKKFKKPLEERVNLIAESCYSKEKNLKSMECNYSNMEYSIWFEENQKIIIKRLSEAEDPLDKLYSQLMKRKEQ